ncbi:MAG: chromosome segregation protein SMC, partial [Cyanobacteria bacterium J06648_11]
DDEAAFKAKLQRESGSVDLDVDFYGRGLFPPVAYHSEGHQDGMGLCLYLALMEQILSASFSFAVLDDVVMSVDTSHRKEFCRLLREKFKDTQFIITTHDKVWLSQMRSAGLINRKSAVTFSRWSVDDGPFFAELKEVWEELDTLLGDEKIAAAAATLRRYLESVSCELADRLGAQIPYRQDGDYDLGEVMPGVVSKWGKLLGKAKSAAQSWNNDDGKQAVKGREAGFIEAKSESDVERWAINPAVHYNEWANFTREDFAPVVAAFHRLLSCFRCDACDTWFHLEPNRATPNTVRCDCGGISLNLKPKS